tara:strand:- start:431 stop:784 length:354 start_codon:yes stop_codon:yes gene_type:complete
LLLVAFGIGQHINKQGKTMNKYKIRIGNKPKEYTLNHLRAFNIKVLPATDYKGTRVVINDLRNKKRVIQSYNYEIGNIKNQGFKFLKDLGIKVNSFYYNEKDYTYTLLTENFETMIK